MANHQDVTPETAEDLIQDIEASIAPFIRFALESATSLAEQLLSRDGFLQGVVLVSAFIVALIAARPVRALLQRTWPDDPDDGEKVFQGGYEIAVQLVFPILWVIGLWIGSIGFRQAGWPNDFIRVGASLLQAWILIRLFSTFVRDPLSSRMFATIAWIVAALNILRLLNPTIAILDGMALNLGEARVSVYMVIKGLAMLILLIWIASAVSRFVQSRLTHADTLTPSVKTLIGQSVRIVLLFAAIMLAMSAIGIDLTTLAVFSGAVGVGIGFGLQAIFSNLVAGIIMLLEGSIKVGDFVELESGLTGEVQAINIRSTQVTTNDNVDILVPNAEFINNRVTNWTLRESFRRTRIPFGVAYGTDKELVKKAALEAAASVPHMLKGKSAKDPQVWLVNFGESSLDFELVVWLDPVAVKRPSAVAADYNWALETTLAKYGIEIPFPQRDLHIRSGQLPIQLGKV